MTTPDLCECGHGWATHVYGSGMCMGETACLCTANRPAPTQQPEHVIDNHVYGIETGVPRPQPEPVKNLRWPCPTPGCPGDNRYIPPGRGHRSDCTYDGSPPEPTRLVERLARTWLVSQNVGIEDHENAPSTLPGYLDLHAARALALSLADWLDEQRMGLGDVPGDYIRREIGETS